MRSALREGDDVQVIYLAARDAGTIEAVEDGGRAVVVVTEDGEVLRFRLSATCQFMTADRGCRLLPGAPR